MEIRIKATGAVMSEGEFRQWARDNNGPSWGQTTPEVLDALGADPVLEGAQAVTTGPYKISVRSGVEQVNGQWFTKYVVGPVFTDRAAINDQPAMTAAEQEAEYVTRIDEERKAAVRTDRNKRLAETDWRFRTDMTPSQEWIDYCQALRDVTSQAGFPHGVQWPEQPA